MTLSPNKLGPAFFGVRWLDTALDCANVSIQSGVEPPHSKCRFPYNTLMLPTVVERRCRVNVSGVVTPSPVGVAMLKLR